MPIIPEEHARLADHYLADAEALYRTGKLEPGEVAYLTMLGLLAQAHAIRAGQGPARPQRRPTPPPPIPAPAQTQANVDVTDEFYRDTSAE